MVFSVVLHFITENLGWYYVLTTAAVDEAMRFSFSHWGLHPWGIYVIFELGIALLHFRKLLALRALL